MATASGKVPQAKRLKVREVVFPGAAKLVYDSSAKGWRQVPRTLSLIMTLIHDLAPKGKGDGAARVYHELWLRDFGEGLVILADDETHAFASGYTTPGHGPRSWRECMTVLKDLGFIKLAPRGSRPFGYALLLDPHAVIERLRKQNPASVPDPWYNVYRQRRIEVGAEK